MTTSAAIQMYLFIHLGVILVVTAYYTVSAALAPQLAERSRTRFAQHPWSTLFIGLAVSIPWVVVAMVTLNASNGLAKFVGGILLALWILAALVGGAGVAQHIGANASSNSNDWTQTVRGGLLMTLTWVLPVVGWFGMLPLTLITGVGCLTKDVFAKTPQPTESASTPAAE